MSKCYACGDNPCLSPWCPFTPENIKKMEAESKKPEKSKQEDMLK